MIINSNPFVYNEGFPTYTDIEAVNDRVTELENDESLLNISKTDAVESLSASLNKLIEDRAKKISSVNITATNNVNAVHFSGAILAVKHNLNSQVGIFQNMLLNNIANNQAFDTLRAENIKATGGTLTGVNFVNVNFVNPQNTTFDNLIVDNLTVFNDFTSTILNQSNFDNVMIRNSTVYNSFLRNANMQGDHADIEYAYIDRMTTNGIDLNVFQVTPQTEPVESETALGYDLNGNVIPVNPLYMVDLVLNAEYISVDTNGDTVASTKSKVVEQSENLITANAVNNAFDDFGSYMSNEDANVYQLFDDTVDNFRNAFNDFNNGFNNLNNRLNDLNNIYNNLNSFAGPEVFNTLNGYNNTLNNYNNSLNGLGDVSIAIFNAYAPEANIYTSGSPVNYVNVRNIEFHEGHEAGTNITINTGDTFYYVNMSFEATNNTLIYSSDLFKIKNVWSNNNIIKNPPRDFYKQYAKILFNGFTANAQFNGCRYFNQPVVIPKQVYYMINTFYNCQAFNQPVTIPEDVIHLNSAFKNCFAFNQYVSIPDSAVNVSEAFRGCRNLSEVNLTIRTTNNLFMSDAFNDCRKLIGDNHTGTIGEINIITQKNIQLGNAFRSCQLLNASNIYVEGNNVQLDYAFLGCRNLNPVVIDLSHTNVTKYMRNTFEGCYNLNASTILLPMSTENLYGTFVWCNHLNANITLPSAAKYMRGTFTSCKNFNTLLTIPENVIDMYECFYSCNNFNQNIQIPSNVKNVSSMFMDCFNLNQNIKIPDNVNGIDGVFSMCRNLTEVTIGNILSNTYARYAFRNCESLRDLYYYSVNIPNNQNPATILENANPDLRIHLSSSVPMLTSNDLYNSFVNGSWGLTIPAAAITNEL